MPQSRPEKQISAFAMEPSGNTIGTPLEQPLYTPLTWTFDDVPWSACRRSLSLLQPATFTRLAAHFSRLTREFFKQQQQPKPESQPTPPPSEPQSAPTPASTPPEFTPEPLVTFTRSDFKAYLVALQDAFKYTPGIWREFLQITNDFIAAYNPSSKQPPSPA